MGGETVDLHELFGIEVSPGVIQTSFLSLPSSRKLSHPSWLAREGVLWSHRCHFTVVFSWDLTSATGWRECDSRHGKCQPANHFRAVDGNELLGSLENLLSHSESGRGFGFLWESWGSSHSYNKEKNEFYMLPAYSLLRNSSYFS